MAVESKDRREALIAEASVWMARLDAGQADEREFEAWRDADPRRAAAFAEVAHTWNRLSVLRGHVEPAETERDSERAARPSRRAMLQAAGVIGFAAVGAGLFAPRVFARNRASTGVGERRSLVLEDGSRVELNTDTAVAWRLQRDLREVWLERGQAAFSVADDRTRPFVLRAHRIDTRLSPGQFDARLREGALDLTILSGRAQPQRPIPTASSATADVREAVGPSSLLITPTRIVDRPLSDADVNSTTSWRRGEIVFDGEPLGSAVQEYNRYLTRKLVIGDRKLASLRLGGRFMTSNPDGFLTALNQAFGVHAVEGEQNQLLLTAEK
jgi:transmembrane sensor